MVTGNQSPVSFGSRKAKTPPDGNVNFKRITALVPFYLSLEHHPQEKLYFKE